MQKNAAFTPGEVKDVFNIVVEGIHIAAEAVQSF